MAGDIPAKLSSADFLTFTAGNSNIEVRYDDGTIWLTQALMADLFGVDVRTVNEHLRNIFESAELDENRTIREFRIVRQEGSRAVNRKVNHYNLDAIISVGYRVNSIRATHFRQWATRVLRDFTLRGYVVDRNRMEAGRSRSVIATATDLRSRDAAGIFGMSELLQGWCWKQPSSMNQLSLFRPERTECAVKGGEFRTMR